MASIALHNYLKETDNAMYCPTGFIDHETITGEVILGRWRKEIRSCSTSNSGNQVANLSILRGRRSEGNALHMRDCFKDYVNSKIGSLPWQLDYVRRTK